MRAVQHRTLASIVDFIYHGEAEVGRHYYHLRFPIGDNFWLFPIYFTKTIEITISLSAILLTKPAKITEAGIGKTKYIGYLCSKLSPHSSTSHNLIVNLYAHFVAGEEGGAGIFPGDSGGAERQGDDQAGLVTPAQSS